MLVNLSETELESIIAAVACDLTLVPLANRLAVRLDRQRWLEGLKGKSGQQAQKPVGWFRGSGVNLV